MRTTIDPSGRLLVPKALRTALGLESGQDLEIRAVDVRLEIEVAPTPMRLVQRGPGVVAVANDEMPSLTAEEVRSTLASTRR